MTLTIEESRDIINFIAQKRGISAKKLLSTIKPNLKRKNNEILTTKTQQNTAKTQQNMTKTQQELRKSQKTRRTKNITTRTKKITTRTNKITKKTNFNKITQKKNKI